MQGIVFFSTSVCSAVLQVCVTFSKALSMQCPTIFPSLDTHSSELMEEEAFLPQQYQPRFRLISHWLKMGHMSIPKKSTNPVNLSKCHVLTGSCMTHWPLQR